MSLTPSRIELTCEFMASLLSGSIRLVTLVCCRHRFGVGFLLRVGLVLRAALRRPPTRDERPIRVRLTGCRWIVVRDEARVSGDVHGSHVSCGSRGGAS